MLIQIMGIWLPNVFPQYVEVSQTVFDLLCFQICIYTKHIVIIAKKLSKGRQFRKLITQVSSFYMT